MDEILRKLQEIERRLAVLESQNGQTSRQSVPQPVYQPAPPPPSYRPESAAPAAIQPVQLASKLSRFIPGEGNIESYIGRWWLGITGAIAVLFGASFFLKYVFENNIIGPAGRVAIEVMAGLLFIILGEWLRRKYTKYSYIISGLGLAMFYLSIYGAFHWYHLIPSQAVAFGFMGAVTAFGVALAIWSNGMELAGLAVSGGLLTPFLLASTTANDPGFFTYLAILSIGILAIAFFRKWHSLLFLGFVGTAANFVSWYGAYYIPDKLIFASSVLAVFYLIYLIAEIAANVVVRKLSSNRDLVFLTLNAAWFFGWMYYLLYDSHKIFLGFLAALLGAIYIAFAYLASLVRSEDRRLLMFLGGIAVVFLTIAVPLELNQNAITIAWAAEAAVLMVLGVMMQNDGLRVFSLGVFIAALSRLLMFDSGPGNLADFIPIVNKRFFTYFMMTASAGVMLYVSLVKRELFSRFERGVQPFLATAINILVLVAITLEIYGFFGAQIYEMERKAQREIQRKTPVAQSGDYYQDSYSVLYHTRGTAEYRSIVNQRNASISVFWTLYAVLLITIGIVLKSAFLRWSALALFGITAGKVFIFDLSALKTPYKIISFTVLGLILLAASYLYFRYQKSLESSKQEPS